MRRLVLKNLLSRPVTEAPPAADAAGLAELAANLDRAAKRRLGRSLAIREVDAGSCNGCELEIHALNNAFYDLERFGLKFVASPRHADVLLVTGPVTKNMREALLRTYNATPDPKWVVAVGDCAANGGIYRRELRGGRGRFQGRPRRSAHPRLPAAARAIAQGPARAARAAIAGLRRATRPRQAQIVPCDARGDRLHLQVRIRHVNPEFLIAIALHGDLPQREMLARQG